MPSLPVVENHDEKKDIEVLVTGFGAFKNYLENPSWLAVKPLNGSYLSTSEQPSMKSFPPSQDDSRQTQTSSKTSSRRIHIQTLQLPVCYQSLLDTVPRLHSSLPTSPFSKPWLDPNNDQDGSSGNGQSYPKGYSNLIHKDFDIILHVGVGLKGELAIETIGHKKGYRLKDSLGLKAPEFRNDNQNQHDGINNRREESEAEKSERLRLEVEKDIDQVLRGFDQGYEEFKDEESIEIEGLKLVEWLKNQNVPTRKSIDAGRFLCDFLCYASCESRRSSEIKKRRAKTLFIHIPPIGENLSTDQAREAIRAKVWFMACLDKGGI